MAISYPLALPTATGIAGVKVTTRSSVAISESPFTFQAQVQKNQGQRFEMSITLPPMLVADAAVWIAWQTSLNGREGTFLIGDPARSTPQGSAASAPGTPLVKGASQTGAALIIDGAPASATGYLKAGDYISLGSGSATRLYMVLQDADSDGSGDVTLTLWPELRSSPANNDPVTVSAAKGLFRLPDNAPGWNAGALLYGMSFNAWEAL